MDTERIQNGYENANGMGIERVQNGYRMDIERISNGYGTIAKEKSVLYKSAVASRLVCLTPERAVRVQALAGDIVLCSWARHFTLTVPLSTQV